MDVVDFVKENKQLYMPKTGPVIVKVPKMQFLMIDGRGAPDPNHGSEEDKNVFGEAVGALYGLTYSIKMSDKKGEAPKNYHNFKVPPLEALWWMDSGQAFDVASPDDWRWTAMMRMPDYVTKEVVGHFADILVKKKKSDIYKKVRLESFMEGPSVQILHIGPYDAEGPNIDKMHAYAKEQGYKPQGKHHEIYYSDPRRTAPEKLKTVLRQPVEKAK